jgi:glycosyltransferase involved in cell wall biosynthesis
MNKVLIITYYWPPSGGAGVQRWLKFAKYLPEFGWEPVILTVDPKYAAYPVTDNSLSDDLPSSVKIYKTPSTDYFTIYKKDKSKIPSAGFANSVDNTLMGKLLRFVRGNFFIPDPRKGWNSYAYKKACEIIETEKIKHVITTSPPHSTQLIGLKIKKNYPGIKWVADLRDPWTDIYYYSQFYPTFISKAIDSQFENNTLKKADRIITVGPSLKTAFSLKAYGVDEKTTVIPNGYDEKDFNGIPVADPLRFTITYVGTLSDIYPVDGFISALKNLNSQGKDFLLRFVGTVSENARTLILSVIPESSVDFISYTAHSEAVKYMMNSSVLLLIIPSHKSSKGIITGKLFEYVAARRPILCLGPADGDAATIINECNSGLTTGYYDTEKIIEFLSNVGHFSGLSEKTAIEGYSRLSLTKKLVDVINSADIPG